MSTFSITQSTQDPNEPKIVNAREMEQWLVKNGAVLISKEIKKEPWFREVSKLPALFETERGC